MKMTIYLPDELAEQVKAELAEANISAICQAALRDEMDRIKARAEIDAQGYERVQAWDQKDEHEVAFQGKSVGGDPDSDTTAYLTPKGALAVVGEGRNSYNDLLAVYDSYDEFASDLAPYGEATGIKRWPYAMVTQVADALGEQPPVEDLDI